MLKKQAVEIAHTLSNPSKMPGRSTSLPIEACNVGSKLRAVPGSTCNGCYAGGGCYQWRSTQEAMEKRLAGITHPDWVAAMITLIGREKEPWFRWHDSGDIQSAQHLERICAIADALPDVQFWLPTREARLVRGLKRPVPSNLTIRVSAAMIDRDPPSWARNTSTVHKDQAPVGYVCPAPKQGGECKDCRACWDSSVPNVSYHKH